MKHSEILHDDISLYIDESESTLPLSKEESKRTSWAASEQLECGLPPTGKRIDVEHGNGTKTSNRIRMRSRPTRTYQLQPSPVAPVIRPISFNERLSPVIQRRESSPSIDRSDFLTDTSSVSSRICSPTTLRPLLGTYHSSSNTQPLSPAPAAATSFITCSKGQDCSYPPLTSQTTSIDTSSDNRCRSMTNDQIDSSKKVNRNSCLKTKKSSGRKKSVHFDCHSPIEIPSSSSSSLLLLNDEDQEKERTRRTMTSNRNIITTSPLTTNVIHRSFSLSPSSSHSKDERHSLRKHRTQIQTSNHVTHRSLSSSYEQKSNPTMPQPIGLNTFLVQTSAKKNPTSSLSRRSKRFSADIESLSNCKSEKNSSLTRTSKTEPFYLSTDDSSLGAPMQTSTLIISTPPQYHYYLYPPSISKKNSSMNSISTSSNSSSSSYDLDDDTLSNATYSVINPTTNPPMVLSDSVQNFWPPPPSPSTFDNDSDDTLIEQNKQPLPRPPPPPLNDRLKTSHNSNESSSMINGNRRDVRLSTKSLTNNEQQVQCLKIESESSLEDTPTSYSERLRVTSRSMNMSRSRMKDCTINPVNDYLRPKSAGSQILLANDFQSKRQFFENRISSNSPCRHVTKCSWNDLSSSSSTTTSTSKPPLATSSNESSTIRTTTTYFDTASNSQLTLPKAIQRKPVRIVRAVQRSTPIDSKSISSKKINLSSQYIRDLFPVSNRPRDYHEFRSMDDSIIDLKKSLEILTDNRRVINEEIEKNTLLGNRLMKIVESHAEIHEIEKLKLHINEIETITSVLLKLSSRLVKVENDLSIATDDTKVHLLEQRAKIREKHDEAKNLKDGIDRRSRLVTNFLRKYLSNEQFDDYEHFIRMKSNLLIDSKDLEENIAYLHKQFDHCRVHSHV